MGERRGPMEGMGVSITNSAFKTFYRGKKVLVTGHTGFKGSWLTLWLLKLGAKVSGFSAYLPSEPCNFEVLGLQRMIEHHKGDVRNFKQLKEVFDDFRPQIVFHLAAQPIVRRSYEDPKLTFDTNVGGTVNVLDCIRKSNSSHVGVIITSDKCYKNKEWVWGYRETDQLGGDDPYSASKGCAELVINSYCQSFFNRDKSVNIVSTRAGNVIGGGDWAEDRIVPDCMRAWAEGREVLIRHPQATRPWQHVLEPLGGYLCLGARLWENPSAVRGEAFNFGPISTAHHSVKELISTMMTYFHGASWKAEPKAQNEEYESTLLSLNCDKAYNLLGWRSILSFVDTIRLTIEWYKTYYEKGDPPMYDLTCRQIEEYVDKAIKLGQKQTI
jgi:CDP-glucose 4,6-dehydratase